MLEKMTVVTQSLRKLEVGLKKKVTYMMMMMMMIMMMMMMINLAH